MQREKLAGARRNPAWTRDELVLALDLYKRLATSEISSKHPDIIGLSNTLNRLRSTDPADPETYRNANGVAMKMHNFGRFDPQRHGVALDHGNRLEELVWNEFKDAPSRLRDAAEKICNRITR